jgi:hypothetical protein
MPLKSQYTKTSISPSVVEINEIIFGIFNDYLRTAI